MKMIGEKSSLEMLRVCLWLRDVLCVCVCVHESRSRASIQFNLILFCEIIQPQDIETPKSAYH